MPSTLTLMFSSSSISSSASNTTSALTQEPMINVTNAALRQRLVCASVSSHHQLSKHITSRRLACGKEQHGSKPVQLTMILPMHTWHFSRASRRFSQWQSYAESDSKRSALVADGDQLDLAEVAPCVSLIKQRRTIDALALLQQHIDAGTLPDRPIGDAILLGIASPGGAGRVGTALKCLQMLPSEKGHYYYQLIKHYSSKRNRSALHKIQVALRSDYRWKAFSQNPIAPWFALVQSYGQLQEPDLAAHAFDTCWQLGHWKPQDVKTANALLNALHADLQATHDRYTLLLSTGFKPDRVTFNTLLKSCMRANNAEVAYSTYQHMVKQKIPADEYTYTTLIKTYSYTGRVEEALNLQRDMAAAGFVLSDTVWGSLMTACGQAGQLQSALRLWEGYKEARQGLHNVSNPEPCQALLIACAHTYQLKPALAVLAEIKQAGLPINVIMYNCVMNACRAPPSKTLSVESVDQAFDLLDDMVSHGVPPDCTTYSTLMNLCAEAKQGHRAYQLLQKLDREKVKLDKFVYTAFIKACGSSPDLLEPAHAAFKRMIWGPRRLKPSQVTFITMLRLFREAGRPHEAVDVYLGMRRAGFPGVNSEFQELVQACAEAALANNDSQLQLKVKTHLLNHQKDRNLETVDLHFLSAKEARAAVLCVLANIQERHKLGKALPLELALIVGKSQHGSQGEPKLRDAVEELLHQQLHVPTRQLQAISSQHSSQNQMGLNMLPYDSQEVTPKRPVKQKQGMQENKGRVTVTRSALLQWLQSKQVHKVISKSTGQQNAAP